LQLSIKVTVPENIVILDSIKTGKEFDALQKPRKQVEEGEEDSDAEEERIIEEAEKNREERKSMIVLSFDYNQLCAL
jgi:hypothetical protein